MIEEGVPAAAAPTPRRDASRREGHNGMAEEIRAEIVANVMTVLVREGDAVGVGHTLVPLSR